MAFAPAPREFHSRRRPGRIGCSRHHPSRHHYRHHGRMVIWPSVRRAPSAGSIVTSVTMTQPNKPHTVHIETFGCQMNEYDSELVAACSAKRDLSFTEDRERADVMLMNTCAIRENAHNKVYGHLAELKAVKEQRPLVVGAGCMAQNLKEELTEKQPLVDVLVGPDGYRQLPGLLTNALMLKPKRGTLAPWVGRRSVEYERMTTSFRARRRLQCLDRHHAGLRQFL